MNSQWQTAIELVKQGTAMLHDGARYLGTVDDALHLQECAEALSMDLAAVCNFAGQRSEQIARGEQVDADCYR